MTNCPTCRSHSVYSTTETNDPSSETIYVLNDWQLLQRGRYQDLARYIAGLPISSREVPNWLAEKIFWYEGQILWPKGSAFEVAGDDIDKAFNDDQSFRWIRSFRNHAYVALKQRPQERLAFRLRLIALAIQIDTQNHK